MNALELSPSQILRQPPTIEPIGLHSLSWRFGNHRRRRDHALISLGLESIIQSIARRSSLIGKGHLLIRKVLANVAQQMPYTIRHAQRFKESLMIGEGHRDTPLVHIESREHIVVTRYKCMAAHRSASFGQWLRLQPLYLLLSTRGEPQHPSYRSQGSGYAQGERKSLLTLQCPFVLSPSTGSGQAPPLSRRSRSMNGAHPP